MARKEKVTRVIDGDTFLTARRKHPVRLANIDTPEKGQQGYMQAKRALHGLITGQEVLIDTKGRDKRRMGTLVKNNGEWGNFGDALHFYSF